MYLLAAGLSFAHPRVALGIVASIMVVWIVPTAKVGPVERCLDARDQGHGQA
jgi:hypothetical protein